MDFSVETSNIQIIKLLLLNDANSESTNLVQFCTNIGNFPLLELSIQKGAKIKIKDKSTTPLHIAASNGNLELVKFFISKNIPINNQDIDGNSPLLIALNHSFSNIAHYLIDHKANLELPNNNNFYPIHSACKNSSTQMIKLLVSKKVNVNVLFQEKITPLIFLIENQDFNNILYLISNGANLNLGEIKGHSILSYFVSTNDDLYRDLIFKKNFDFHYNGSSHITPLHYAAQNDDVELMSFFLDKGININSLDSNIKFPILIEEHLYILL